MSTPADQIAQELRNEIEARLNAAKRERDQLAGAAARIAELDAFIAYLEDETRTEFRVAPRPAPRLETQPEATPRAQNR